MYHPLLNKKVDTLLLGVPVLRRYAARQGTDRSGGSSEAAKRSSGISRVIAGLSALAVLVAEQGLEVALERGRPGDKGHGK
jgi:hypothetical protein